MGLDLMENGVGVTYGENGKLDLEARMGWFGVSGAGICMKFWCATFLAERRSSSLNM